jgi:hypothetical protein
MPRGDQALAPSAAANTPTRSTLNPAVSSTTPGDQRTGGAKAPAPGTRQTREDVEWAGRPPQA